MCYLVVERYSVCRCLFYKHSVDMCAAWGQEGHPIQERTVLVGYACEKHSQYQEPQAPSSRDGYSDSGYGTASHASHRHSSRRSRDLRTSLNLEIRAGVASGSRTSTDAKVETSEAPIMKDRGPDSEKTKKMRGETGNKASTIEPDDEESYPEPESSNSEPVQGNVLNDTLGRNSPGVHKKDNLPGSHLDREFLPLASVENPNPSDSTTYLDPLRSRLLDSEAYFKSLSELEKNVWLNSSVPSLSIPKRETLDQNFVPYPETSFHLPENSLLLQEPLSDHDVTSLCAGQAAFEALNLLRECRNIAMRTYLNLRRLQLAGFCGTQFSIIIPDRSRQNVARLVMVDISQVVCVLKSLELWLQDSARKIPNINRASFAIVVTNLVVRMMPPNFGDCDSLREVFGELDTVLPDRKSPLTRVWLYVCMLDVGVVSYAGAHLSDIISEYYPHGESEVYFRPVLLKLEVVDRPFVVLRRASLQCLDEFHDGKPVWVISAHDWSLSGSLYLSTTMFAFADIWGPLWKAADQKQPGKYAAYIVGNGSILCWKHDPFRDPILLEQETFCHWISEEALDQDEDSQLSSNIVQRSFIDSENLLIGAPTLGAAALDINVKCRPSISKARQRLRDMGRLCILGAARPYVYSDGSQYQLQIGYSGVSASATKQYKRNVGQTLKNVLVELWSMEPGLRDPRILTDLHGVEVSICTHNAQRVSLAYLLGLNCMHFLLSGFNWKNEQYMTEHFETLKDPSRQLRQAEPEFREQFEQAVMLCLKMLSKTGLGRKESLSVFLSSACTPKPELATLVSREHSWIGLLKDTTTECAMAAFGDQCLVFKHSAGAKCGGDGNSAFLTAIVPNRHVESLRSWEVEKLQVGEGFWLGERGVLRLKSHAVDGILVMVWRPSGLRTALKVFRGKEYPHREYTEVDLSGEEGVRPIPVVVESDRGNAPGKVGATSLLAGK